MDVDTSRLDRPVDFTTDSPPLFVEFDNSILEGQPRIVVFNVAGPGQRPMHTCAAIRILGFFNTIQDAKCHCELHYGDAGLVYAIHACTLGQDVALAPSFELQYNEDYTTTAIRNQVAYARDNIMARYEAHRERLGTATRTAQDVTSDTASSDDDMPSEGTPSEGIPSESTPSEDIPSEDIPSSLSTVPPPVPRVDANTVPVLNQAVSVVGVLHGASGVDPVCTIYGVFNKMEEATSYIRNVVSTCVIDRPLFVVDCYSWLYPHMLSEKPVSEEEWRNEKESTIMRAQQTQHAASVAFRRSRGLQFGGEKVDEMGELPGPESDLQ